VSGEPPETPGNEERLFCSKKAATFKKADWPPNGGGIEECPLV